MLQMRRDLAFYKDSLEDMNGGNVRIDYLLHPTQYHKEIRIKKYSPDGDIFVQRPGELSRLKIEDDTVRIIMSIPRDPRWKITDDASEDRFIQVTFCLNNYTDIDDIAKDKEMLNHIIDTLAKTSASKWPLGSTASVIYRPYLNTDKHSKSMRMQKTRGVLEDERFVYASLDKIVIGGSIGAGLLRNTLTPVSEINLEYQYHSKVLNQQKYYSFVKLSATHYFLFSTDIKGHNIVSDNGFINLEFGKQQDAKFFGAGCRRASVGIGYLSLSEGGYFQNLTMKAFTNIEIVRGLTICPEFIFTNNFKQIFPGITLKIF